MIHRHAAERPAMLLMVAVLLAYPIAASFGAEIWIVAAAGALASLGVCRAYQVRPVRKAASQVSPDILVFLWGIFLVVHGLRAADVADQLRALGPRLLPVGSLAGLLWIDLLRRSGVEVGVGPVLRLGTLVVLPTLAASLAMLWLLRP